MTYTKARVVDDRVELGKKVAAFGIAAFAAGLMMLAAPAEEALAAEAVQTAATTTSISANIDFGSYYASENPVPYLVEVAEKGSDNYTTNYKGGWATVDRIYIEGLKPGTEYTVKVSFKYGTGGKYDSSIYLYDLCTVAEKVKDLQIGYFYSSLDKMSVCFSNPGTIYGYEVEMDAFAGSKYDKKIKDSWTYGNSYSTVINSDSVKMNLKTAYKARVRTCVQLDNGTKAWSEWSDKTVLVPQPKVNSRYYNVSGGVKVSWGKVAGAKSYTMYGSTKNGAYKKIATVKGTSMKISKIKGSKLKKGKKYCLYIQANVPSGSKTYKSKKHEYVTFTY